LIEGIAQFDAATSAKLLLYVFTGLKFAIPAAEAGIHNVNNILHKISSEMRQ
jgi:hypothetical protein